MTEPAKEEEDLEPGEIGSGDEPEAADDPDERSVFVKNVDFSVSEDMLAEHFKECGQIERQTIRKNAQTGQSLG
jgi:RNA recognition motif-containing protein